MDTKYYVIFLICLFLSFWLGYWYGRMTICKHRDGIFKVDTLNPEKDVFTLEVEVPLGAIPNKKFVIFEVQNAGSQEKPFA